MLVYSACGVMSCSTPIDILSWVRSAVQGENLEPISVTAVCLRTAVVVAFYVSVLKISFLEILCFGHRFELCVSS